jgi:hypothetical protein
MAACRCVYALGYSCTLLDTMGKHTEVEDEAILLHSRALDNTV